jgi:hypothetical protein
VAAVAHYSWHSSNLLDCLEFDKRNMRANKVAEHLLCRSRVSSDIKNVELKCATNESNHDLRVTTNEQILREKRANHGTRRRPLPTSSSYLQFI